MNNQFKPLRFDELTFHCVDDVYEPFFIHHMQTVIHQSEHYFNSISEYYRYYNFLTMDCNCHVFHELTSKECFVVKNYLPQEGSPYVHTFIVKIYYRPSLIQKKSKNV